MNGKELVSLKDLEVSNPKILEISGQLISIDGFFILENIATKIVIENYGGLRQISIYSGLKKIVNYPLFYKRECLIKKVIEDDKEIIIIASQ